MWSTAGEDQGVRQYRFLLRTAPLDALEEAHVEVLSTMARSRVALVLRGLQEGLVTGLRLGPDDVRPIAHRIALGERRRPGDFLAACPRVALLPLAEAVIVSEAMFGRFGGYAAWDGAEPELDEGAWTDGGFGEPWHDVRETRVLYRGALAGLSTPDTFAGSG